MSTTISTNFKFKELGINYQNALSNLYFESFSFNVKKNMGTCMGNTLRSVLLSQIPGYAIKYVCIDGILHEFSNIAGVKESAQTLIMNLRKVVFSGETDFTKVNLNVNKAGEVFAGDIKSVSLKIVNPNIYICTLNQGAELKVEIYVEKGIGLLLARDSDFEVNSKTDARDAILCDAFYSPILKVNFGITHNELDKLNEILTLDIETDGSISPKDALNYAVNLLNSQFSNINKSNAELVLSTENIEVKPIKVVSKNLNLKIEQLENISKRVIRCLKSLGIIYVGHLVQYTSEQLLQEPQFGATSLDELSDVLNALGLKLGTKLDDKWKAPEEEDANEDYIR